MVNGDYRGKNLGYRYCALPPQHPPPQVNPHSPLSIPLTFISSLLSDVLLCCVVRLIDHLQSVARDSGCYKVILCCEDKNIAFYAKLGFKPHANHLANYFQPLGGGARKNSNS